MSRTDKQTKTNCFCFFAFVTWFNLVSIFSLAGPSDSSRLSFAAGRRPLQPFRCGFLETCALPAGKSQAAPRRERHLQLEPVAVTAGSPMWFVRILPLNCTFTAFNSLRFFHSFFPWLHVSLFDSIPKKKLFSCCHFVPPKETISFIACVRLGHTSFALFCTLPYCK